jgi:hypothetical protein
MPWKKGQSGNPKGIGVGKEKLMRQALMMELKSACEDLPELRQIARRVIDCALNDEENWSWAVKEIWDRLDGKPQQTVEPIIAEKRTALDWTTDELVAWLNEHAADGERAPEKKKGDREPFTEHRSNAVATS